MSIDILSFFRRKPGEQKSISSPAKSPVTWVVIAVTFVAGWEGFYGHVYRDSVGVPTICYGATAADNVDLTRTYTKQECQDMLARDLPKYDAMVKRCLTATAYAALPPHRHAAVVSFTYNLGGGALCKSSVARNLNAGKIQDACDAMLAYVRAGGRVLQGLVNRRRAERALCLEDN
jgi:lysozyme